MNKTYATNQSGCTQAGLEGRHCSPLLMGVGGGHCHVELQVQNWHVALPLPPAPLQDFPPHNWGARSKSLLAKSCCTSCLTIYTFPMYGLSQRSWGAEVLLLHLLSQLLLAGFPKTLDLKCNPPASVSQVNEGKSGSKCKINLLWRKK